MKPMLAAKVTGDDLHNLSYPLMASAKLDGIRCLIIGGHPVTRNLKPIRNKHIYKALTGCPAVDGEIIVGDPRDADAFAKTSSIVMSENKLLPDDTCFWIFDSLNYTLPFDDRIIQAKDITTSFRSKFPMLRFVSHKQVDNAQEVLDFEASMLLAGFEGVMLRHPQGPYKFGRSTLNEQFLLKLKRFEESEAEVIGFVSLKHNNNELTKDALGRAKRSTAKHGLVSTDELGAIKVKDLVTGVEFEIGSGFTHAQRMVYWLQQEKLLGHILTYKYQPTGIKDKPRFPVFKGFRTDIF